MPETDWPGAACAFSDERIALGGFACFECAHDRRDHCTRGRKAYPVYGECGWRKGQTAREGREERDE